MASPITPAPAGHLPSTTYTSTDYAHHYAAEALDKAGIPNVLILQVAMGYYGVEGTGHGIDFVVPDHLLPYGVPALVSAGFLRCDNPHCHKLRGLDSLLNLSNRNASEVGKVFEHVHFQDWHKRVIQLRPHSTTLWKIPNLTPSEIGPDHDITYASDENLQSPAPVEWYPVKVVTLHRQMEAYYLMSLRHKAGLPRPQHRSEADSWREEHFWRSNFDWINLSSRACSDYLNESLLPPSFRRYYLWGVHYEQCHRSLRPRPSLKAALARLKADLISEDPWMQAVFDAIDARALEAFQRTFWFPISKEEARARMEKKEAQWEETLKVIEGRNLEERKLRLEARRLVRNLSPRGLRFLRGYVNGEW